MPELEEAKREMDKRFENGEPFRFVPERGSPTRPTRIVLVGDHARFVRGFLVKRKKPPGLGAAFSCFTSGCPG